MDGCEPKVWAGDLPARLQQLHSHWLCRDHGGKQALVLRRVGFRDAEVQYLALKDRFSDRWRCMEVPEHLRRRCKDQSLPWTGLCEVKEDMDCLVVLARGSEAGAKLMKILAKFENVEFIHALRPPAPDNRGNSQPTSLQLVMPRYGLRFKLTGSADGAELSSLDFVGYRLQKRQMLDDSLFGFRRYLLLERRAKLDTDSGRPMQKVLIPDGLAYRNHGEDDFDDGFGLDGDQTDAKAFVDLKFARTKVDASLQSVCYDVHPRLNYLVANNTRARLLLASLYAASSSLVPDARVSMTGASMTGADYATQLVRQSFQNWPLTPDEFDRLQCVVDHCQHSPTLALICGILEDSANSLCPLHAPFAEDEQSPSGERRLHFPHPDKPPGGCSLHRKGLCEAKAQYVSAYMQGLREEQRHARRELQEEEEAAVLGGMRSRVMDAQFGRWVQVEESEGEVGSGAEEGGSLVRKVESLLSFIAGERKEGAWKEDQDLKRAFLDAHKQQRLRLRSVCNKQAGRKEAQKKSSLRVATNVDESAQAGPPLCGLNEQQASEVPPEAGVQALSPEKEKRFPLRGMEAKHMIGRDMLEELEGSWNAHVRVRERRKERRPPITDMCALESLVMSVGKMVNEARRSAEDGALERLRRVPERSRQGAKFRMMRSANMLPSAGTPDLLAVMLSKRMAGAFNPLLGVAEQERVNAEAVEWAALCVLEDKIQRLVALISEKTADEETASASSSSQTSALSRKGVGGAEGFEIPPSILKELDARREWAPSDHPEWLAFEVEGGLQIRPRQYHVAKHLLDPENAGAIVQVWPVPHWIAHCIAVLPTARSPQPQRWTLEARHPPEKPVAKSPFLKTKLRKQKHPSRNCDPDKSSLPPHSSTWVRARRES